MLSQANDRIKEYAQVKADFREKRKAANAVKNTAVRKLQERQKVWPTVCCAYVAEVAATGVALLLQQVASDCAQVCVVLFQPLLRTFYACHQAELAGIKLSLQLVACIRQLISQRQHRLSMRSKTTKSVLRRA